MIRDFADKETERLFHEGKTRAVPPDLRERALAKLLILNAATNVEDLRSPPGNRLERLKGARAEQWSIRINQQYRICFTFEGVPALEVEITDYH